MGRDTPSYTDFGDWRCMYLTRHFFTEVNLSN